MGKLITLLEKLVFFVAGAVIVILALISKSRAEPVYDVEPYQETVIEFRMEAAENW